MADKEIEPHQSDEGKTSIHPSIPLNPAGSRGQFYYPDPPMNPSAGGEPTGEVTDVKTNETQGMCQATNQEENDQKVTSTDTDAVANNDDAHTQEDYMVENATREYDTEGPFVDHDRDDREQIQQENRNKIDCEADGLHITSNEKFGDSSRVSTEETTAAPPVNQDSGGCEMTQEENLNQKQCEKKNNIGEEVDGPHVKSEESEDFSSKGTTAAPAGGDYGTGTESNPKMVSGSDVETIGPTIQAESAAISDVPPTITDNKRRLWIGVVLAVVVAALLQQLLQPEPPPPKKDVHPIDIFRKEMEKVKLQFPSQREELWKRSRIHLQRHFLITQPTEPVSIILTAGVRAEGTLRCLAWSIASALASALNASALHLEGSSKSNQDSDMVKSDIDSQLQKAFEGGKPIAVIHRFEELPPASTLIFYRYCDHENAAFKKTFLIFTVLLGEEQEIEAKIRLSEVEEMVTDHLQKKFLAHDHPTAFDKMDIDKYGGLWSRISHLILPVSTERTIEKTGQC